jgi:hypothetical protein
MPVIRSRKWIAFAALSFVFGAQEAGAANCDLPKPADAVTDARQIRIHAAAEAYWARLGSPSDRLVFALPGADGTSVKFAEVKVPAKGDRRAVPHRLARQLAKAKEVQLFNFAHGRDSLYFAPFTKDGLKGFHPRSGCADAWKESPEGSLHAGTGCSTLNLRGLEAFTLLYGDLADACDKVHEVQRDAEIRQGEKPGDLESFIEDSEYVLYKNAVATIEKTLNAKPGVDRRPELEQPRVANTEEKQIDRQRREKKMPPAAAPPETKSRAPDISKKSRSID